MSRPNPIGDSIVSFVLGIIGMLVAPFFMIAMWLANLITPLQSVYQHNEMTMIIFGSMILIPIVYFLLKWIFGTTASLMTTYRKWKVEREEGHVRFLDCQPPMKYTKPKFLPKFRKYSGITEEEWIRNNAFRPRFKDGKLIL